MFQRLSQKLDSRIAQQFGGRIGIELLTEASTLEAFRIDYPPRSSEPDMSKRQLTCPTVGGHNVIAGPAIVPGIWREKLVASWLSPRNYQFGLSKGCYTHWDAAYRFTRVADELVVSFCFTCGDFKVHLNGTEIVHEIETYYHSLGSLIVARTVFPNDEELQRAFCMD